MWCCFKKNETSVALLDNSKFPYEEYSENKTSADIQQLISKLYHESNDDKINELLKENYKEEIDYEEKIEEYTLTNQKGKFILNELNVCAYLNTYNRNYDKAYNNLKKLEEKWSLLNSTFYTPLNSSLLEDMYHKTE